MDMIIAVVVLIAGPFAALAAAALHFGTDSRLTVTDRATRWI